MFVQQLHPTTHYDLYQIDGYQFVPLNFSPDLNTFVHYTGELIDSIKREYIYGKPREVERIRKAVAHVYVFLYSEYNNLGTPRSEVLQANALKLEKRYAGLYYSDEAAQARADKT